MSQPSFRDVEMLSAYLDGQLSRVDSVRLESRIKADPGLRSVYDDLRESRSLLRKLPARRAPRNFTLTSKMAGIKPPLPRAFPIFQLASALTAVLFFFSYAVNLSIPAMAALRAAAAPAPAFGMGGGAAEEPAAAMAPAATEAFAPDEVATATMAVEATAAPELSTQQDPLAFDSTTETAPPAVDLKINPYAQNDAQRESLPLTLPVPPAWLFGLLALSVLSGGTALFVHAKVEQDWRRANALKPRRMTTRDILVVVLALLAILLLGAGIYWMSTTTFYAPAAQSMNYPSGPAGGDKGSGLAGSVDKGSAPAALAQEIPLAPGMAYNFTAADDRGFITAIDFPADAVKEQTLIRYIPGLDTSPPEMTYFAGRAFTLIPESKATTLQAPVMITIDYDHEAAGSGETLSLYWWSGSEWRDAATTCSPESAYERLPDDKRIRVAACQLGAFLLVAP